jgi:signal transduction histidine kinase/CheY-like chemotaxis protein
MVDMEAGLADRLARERRARLLAERRLEEKSRELIAANEKLALHARALTDQFHAQRQVAASARSEAATLKGMSVRVVDDLERANVSAVMAERRLWDSINAISDGFAVFDGSHRLVVANRAYLAPFDAFPEIRPGVRYPDLLRLCARCGIVDLGTEDGDAWVARMCARWDAETIEPVELRLASGLWMRMIDVRARGGDMVSLAVNITPQMRLQAAIEAVPDGFVVFDSDSRLVMSNARFRAFHARCAESLLPGTRFEDILRAGLRNGQFPGAKGREAEWLAHRLDRFRSPGEAHEERLGDAWVRVTERATPDGGRVVLMVDITGLKTQQSVLEAARAGAEAASRAKSAFLANMSHEIRTPMNGVVGMAELLCDTFLNEEQRVFAETIRSSGEALLVIINDILDYSKIEADKLTLHPEPFDLERMVHEVAMILQPRAQEVGLDLQIDYDMFLPSRFVGDRGRVRQVLTNLMGNAVKFTERGHVLVRVTGLEAGAGRIDVHVAVEDTGIGIAPEHLDRIFGEFSQVDEAASRRFEGTGLGLAISRGLIDRMGGEVWVDSAPGQGSVFGFRLRLPVAPDAGQHPDMPVSLRRAVVIDDSMINRRILEHQLAAAGLRVSLCRSGAEALALLRADPDHDVALIDHDMTAEDGLAVLRSLRGAGYRLPVLLLAAAPADVRLRPDADQAHAIIQTPALRWDIFHHLAVLSRPAAARLVSPPPAPMGRQMRVLAAEDNRTNQLVFAKMVRDLDIDLRFVSNGIDAVREAAEFMPDLIFMDVSMPEMDGRDATRAIRAAEGDGPRHVPIVALTAHAMQGDEADVLQAGMDRYLTKPLRKVVLVETIQGHCPPEARPPQAGQQAAQGPAVDARALASLSD